MTTINWLHLTDLHLGMTGLKDLWPNVEEQFFNDLEFLRDKVGAWDFVLFTGDLTQRGSSEEFGQVSLLLDKFWKKFSALDCEPRLLTIPGNHDLTRPGESDTLLTLTDLWESPKVQTSFWGDPKSAQRVLLNKAFGNYAKWWQGVPARMKPNEISRGELAGDFAATWEKEGVKLGILGLNTTFLQLIGGNLKGKLAVDVRQFNAACGGNGPDWAQDHDLCLLLTHQPPDWLFKGAQAQLNGEIHSPPHRFALHLFGHMHEPDFRSLAEGGASARRRLQGCSLFSKEPWGKKKERRLHGYSLCQLTVDGDNGRLRIWPRTGVWKKNGDLEIDRDPGFTLSKEDGGTEPMTVRFLRARRGFAKRPSAGSHPQADQQKEFESLERFKALGEIYKDKAFKARQVERTLMVYRPNVEMEAREDLVNISRQPQAHVMRCFVTDTPTEESDLEFKAWVKLNGREVRAPAILSTPANDHRRFAYRISFGGQLIEAGKSVQIRMKWKVPNSVPLDDDYWVFSTEHFEKQPETLIIRVAFAKNPADRRLFAKRNDGSEEPVNVPEAVEVRIKGKIWHMNTVRIKSPRGPYVFEWQYPRFHASE